MTGALGTYAAALFVIAASTAAGAGILALSGRRQWSWTAPAVGLAAITILAWWAVRLPGHGWTALGAVLFVALAGAAFAAMRLEGVAEGLRAAVPVLGAVLVATALPFVLEGHFGVLGTGFNVDMSQHLFAASWLFDPSGSAPGLYEQGYPLGPHALAVAAEEFTRELTTAFSGVTIGVVAVIGLTALSGTERWPWWRAAAAAALTAVAYLVSTLFAQGAFKELFEIAFLLGFALWLAELRGTERSVAMAAPGAVLAAGTLYAYSSPGIAWIAGTLLAWAVFEVLRKRTGAGDRVRAALPALGVGVAMALVLVAPEIDRISEFGGSVGSVSDSSRADRPPRLLVREGVTDAGSREPGEKLEFDDDLGNLFGQISPLEALGIWPSGDFRVAPGDGGVPAIAFYLGALLGALALGIGVVASVRAGETALLAALAAALAIWIGARIGSTPYTAAKALAVLGAVAMLISLRGVLRPPSAERKPLLPGALGAAVAAAFVLAAAASSALALGNAPVGPSEYHSGVRDLVRGFDGRATLVVVEQDVYDDERAEEFYGWEFREASPPCVIRAMRGRLDGFPPAGFRRVAVVGGSEDPPFEGLELLGDADGVTLWAVPKHEGDLPRGVKPSCSSV